MKFLLKIWPAFAPILAYFFWILVAKKIISKRSSKSEKIIDGKFKIIGKKSTKSRSSSGYKSEAVKEKIGKFSLKNRQFLIALYLSFSLAILTLIYTAFSG